VQAAVSRGPRSVVCTWPGQLRLPTGTGLCGEMGQGREKESGADLGLEALQRVHTLPNHRSKVTHQRGLRAISLSYCIPWLIAEFERSDLAGWGHGQHGAGMSSTKAVVKCAVGDGALSEMRPRRKLRPCAMQNTLSQEVRARSASLLLPPGSVSRGWLFHLRRR
jgi:hypothetical protein